MRPETLRGPAISLAGVLLCAVAACSNSSARHLSTAGSFAAATSPATTVAGSTLQPASPAGSPTSAVAAAAGSLPPGVVATCPIMSLGRMRALTGLTFTHDYTTIVVSSSCDFQTAPFDADAATTPHLVIWYEGGGSSDETRIRAQAKRHDGMDAVPGIGTFAAVTPVSATGTIGACVAANGTMFEASVFAFGQQVGADPRTAVLNLLSYGCAHAPDLPSQAQPPTPTH